MSESLQELKLTQGAGVVEALFGSVASLHCDQ